MRRGKRMRWRESRNTLTARRHRRRSHRRDVERGGTYHPIDVEPGVAQSGVRFRLVGAVFAALVTVVSVLAGVFAPHSFGAIFGFATGLCSFGAAVGLLMSARHEEKVHALAASLGDAALLEHQPENPPDQTDGLVGDADSARLPGPAQTDGSI